MIHDLEKLGLTLNSLTESDAKEILGAISKRIADILNPHIIDIFWKEEAARGIILRPFISADQSKRRGARAYEVPNHISETPSSTGIWTWVYHHRKPVWLENIRGRDMNSPLQNKASGEEITPAYLDIFLDTDSLLAVPLMFKDEVWGVFSVELSVSGKLSEEFLELMERLSIPVANILWKSDFSKINEQQTSDAIKMFVNSILTYSIQEILSPYRSGFIARPFASEYKVIQDSLITILERKEIQAKHYEHCGMGVVVDDIMNQIKTAHFGIIDVTEFNPNVMLELGMMMILQKKFILLRRQGDTVELPFDIRPYHCYEYKLEDSQLYFWNAGNNQFEHAEGPLENFVRELSADPSFAGAKPWNP